MSLSISITLLVVFFRYETALGKIGLQHLGRISLGVYVIHMFVIHLLPPVEFVCSVFLVMSVVLGFCYFVVSLLEKNKLISLLCLGYKK